MSVSYMSYTIEYNFLKCLYIIYILNFLSKKKKTLKVKTLKSRNPSFKLMFTGICTNMNFDPY